MQDSWATTELHNSTCALGQSNVINFNLRDNCAMTNVSARDTHSLRARMRAAI